MKDPAIATAVRELVEAAPPPPNLDALDRPGPQRSGWRTAAAVLAAMLVLGAALTLAGGARSAEDVTADAALQRQAVPPGAWTGVRSAGARVLVVGFVGATSFRAGDPCSARYVAHTTETARTVRVRIVAESPAPRREGACDAVGHPRSLRVPLHSPLGTRSVVRRGDGAVLPVFDGSVLHRPGWLPAGYRRLEERAFGSASWQRTWARAAAEDGCTGRPPIVLVEGPPADLDGLLSAGPRLDSADVGGSTAVVVGPSTGDARRVGWHRDGEELVLLTDARCSADRPLSVAELLRVARSLGPSSSGRTP